MKFKLNENDMITFESYCPEIIDNAIDIYKTEDERFVAEMNDGDFVIYDFILGTSMRTNDPYKKYYPETEEEFRKYFARKLYRMMRYRGFNQDDLSMRTGLSVCSISRYMNGVATPSAFKIKLLAKALRCSVEDLIDL